MRKTLLWVILFVICIIVSVLNRTSAAPTGTYDGQSPFRRFVSFYFSYTSKSPPKIPSIGTTPEPSRNDYNYHYENNQESGASSLALVNTTCSWNVRQKKFATECDMYNTNLFCHPASHTCNCFSWTSMKAYNVTSEIFYEDDEEIRNYLTNLGDFLAIEMEWNEGLNKCQSLKGSACSVPDNLSDQFQDTYYVSCYPGLSCVAVQDEGFVIGRCMELTSAELEYLHDQHKASLEEGNQNNYGNKLHGVSENKDDIVVEVPMENPEDISAID